MGKDTASALGRTTRRTGSASHTPTGIWRHDFIPAKDSEAGILPTAKRLAIVKAWRTGTGCAQLQNQGPALPGSAARNLSSTILGPATALLGASTTAGRRGWKAIMGPSAEVILAAVAATSVAAEGEDKR